MEKLIVNLPAIKRALRNKNNVNTEKKIVTSKERVRKYRENIKKDNAKFEKMKMKKKEENRLNKERIRQKRQSNLLLDNDIKANQRKWKKKSRQRQATKENAIKEKPKPKTSKQKKQASIRKIAERVRRNLPESPRAWAKTIKLIVNKATPKKHSQLIDKDEHQGVEEILELGKVGRPTKENKTVKRKLAFANIKHSLSGEKKWRLNRYKKRKDAQMKGTLSKPKAYKAAWKEKLTNFLESNSRIMPNKKDTLLINGIHVPKRHLLSSKRKMYRKFIKQYPNFSRKFTTFLSMIPKYYKCLNLACRRVCVCMKDYNLEQQINALNKAAQANLQSDLQTTNRELSDISVCPYDIIPCRKCVNRDCENCGTDSIQSLYEPLLSSSGSQTVKFHQWEQAPEMYTDRKGETKKTTRWIQSAKKETIQQVVNNVASTINTFTSHIFRVDYQHRVEADIMANLPRNHCLAVMDFSENIALQPQDEIESAHWAQKQVTLHPIYIVPHGLESTVDSPIIVKESLVVISDHLKHNADAVFTFTEQLILHLQNKPGPEPITVLHRFTDNCAAQYKCKSAFEHLLLLERKHNIEVVYHYTESGHGKGPSDGIGAGIKKKLERLILGGKVINNAYQSYLALTQNPGENVKQHVIYVPSKKIRSAVPQKLSSAKPVPGTQSYHMVRQWRPGTGILMCSDLSCSCQVCVTKEEGPCFYAQYRNPDKFFNLKVGKQILQKNLSEDMTLSSSVANPHACVDRARHSGDESIIENGQMASLVSHAEEVLRHDEIMADFQAKIAVKGWKIRGQTPSDGNCFFWAISDQLYKVQGNSKTHSKLRKCVVEHIKNLSEENKTKMSKFMTTDLQSYVANIGTDGAYADHLCFSVISKVLTSTILIVHADNPDIREGRNPNSVLAIGYLPELQHYVSVEPDERYVPDDFVAVSLTSRRKKFLYVAKVLKVDGSDVQLRFMKGATSTGLYTWPKTDDMSWQSPDDILRKLTLPTIMPGRGLKMKFDTNELEL